MKSFACSCNCTSLFLALSGILVGGPAVAQPPPPSSPAPMSPAAPRDAATSPAPQPDPLAAALAPKPGGLTADEVAKIVAKNKHSVRAKQEDLKAAAAKVDQAFVNFFPRVSVSATYTRLSEVPGFNLGSGALVAAQNGGLIPAGTIPAGTTVTLPPSTPDGQPTKLTCTSPAGCFSGLIGATVSLPVPLNATSLVASLAVPISDYVLRIAQGYSAASHSEKAARFSAEAESYQAAADARIAYFNWVRAKGGVVVAKEAIDQAQAHVDDAKKAFAVGLASKADVLRIEAQLAAAQQGHAEARSFAAVAEEQLRTLINVPSHQVLEIGSDVMNEPATAPPEALDVLQEQAMARRAEVQALDETIHALRKVESVTRAGYYPRLDAFADATYANPNQRIFPQKEEWKGTWDAGVRLSWTLNDSFAALGASAEAKARTASVMEQKGSLRDGLRIEVASAYADALKAPTTIEAADRGLIAAEESLRVRRELFRNGKATSSELVDAEAEVTRARLNRLNAHVGQLVARARLEHATGRDVPVKPLAN